MSPEEKQILKETAELAKENNKILRGMRRSARFGLLWKIFYWVVIIVLSYGTYVYVQPYITIMQQTYSEMQKNIQSVKDVTSKIPSIPNISNLGR